MESEQSAPRKVKRPTRNVGEPGKWKQDRKTAYCDKCRHVGTSLPKHIEQTCPKRMQGVEEEISRMPAAEKRGLTDEQIKEKAKARLKDQVMKRNLLIVNNLTRTVAISESSLKAFFHDKETISYPEALDLLARLGHIVLQDGTESKTCPKASYAIPTTKAAWTVTSQNEESREIHDAEDAVQPEDQVVDEVVGEGEDGEGGEDDEVVGEGEDGEGESDDNYEPGEEDEDDEDDEDEFEDRENVYDEKGEPRWKDLSKNYKSGTRKKLKKGKMYLGYNVNNIENKPIRDYQHYKRNFTKPKATAEEESPTWYNEITTETNHICEYCYFGATDGFTKKECPPLTIELILDMRNYAFKWLNRCKELGMDKSGLKTRKDSILHFAEWLLNHYLLGQLEYVDGINSFIRAINYEHKNIKKSTVRQETPIQRKYMKQTEMLTIADVMRFEEHPTYLAKLANLENLLTDPEFLEKMEQVRGHRDKMRQTYYAEVRDQFEFLIGAIATIFCLRHGQRPSVVAGITMAEVIQAQRFTDDDGVEYTVFYARFHKTGGNEGNKPAKFTLLGKESRLVDIYNQHFRPLVVYKADKLLTKWLMNQIGKTMKHSLSQKIYRWQVKIYGQNSNIKPATSRDARTAIQTLAHSQTLGTTDSQRVQIASYLSHSTVIAKNRYARDTLKNVVDMSKAVRELVAKSRTIASEATEDRAHVFDDVPADSSVTAAAAETSSHQEQATPVHETTGQPARKRKMTGTSSHREQASPDNETSGQPAHKRKRIGNYRGSIKKVHSFFNYNGYEQDYPYATTRKIPGKEILKKYLNREVTTVEYRKIRDQIRNEIKAVQEEDIPSPSHRDTRHQQTEQQVIVGHGDGPGPSRPDTRQQHTETQVNDEDVVGDAEPQVDDVHDNDQQGSTLPDEQQQGTQPQVNDDLDNEPSSPDSSRQQDFDLNIVRSPVKIRPRRCIGDLSTTFQFDKGEDVIRKHMKDQMWPHVYRKETAGYGTGVFVNKDVGAGEILCDYPGEMVLTDEYNAMIDETMETAHIREYAQELDEEWVILGHSQDPEEEKGPLQFGYGHYINHTPHKQCKNVREQVVYVPIEKGSKKKRNVYLFRADSKIKAGEQLLRQYGQHYDWPAYVQDLLAKGESCPKCNPKDSSE